MKKNIMLQFFAVFIAISFVISCAGAPKDTKTPPVPATPLENSNNQKIIDDAADGKTSLSQLNEMLNAAREKRDEIIENGFTEHDPESYAKANAALERAEQAASSGGDSFPASVKDDSELAYTTFLAVLDAAWLEKVDVVRKDAEAAQQVALKAKADVAVKAEYNLAAEIFNNGSASYKNREWKDSLNFYTDAKPQFESVTAAANEKKQFADLALQRAEMKISESEKIAGEAEEFLKNNPQELDTAEGETL